MSDPLWRFKTEAVALKNMASAERIAAKDCEVRAQAYEAAADSLLAVIARTEKDAVAESSQTTVAP